MPGQGSEPRLPDSKVWAPKLYTKLLVLVVIIRHRAYSKDRGFVLFQGARTLLDSPLKYLPVSQDFLDTGQPKQNMKINGMQS